MRLAPIVLAAAALAATSSVALAQITVPPQSQMDPGPDSGLGALPGAKPGPQGKPAPQQRAPVPQPTPVQPGPAPGGQPGPRAPSGPASPIADWKSGPGRDPGGGVFCAAEARYNNGLVLLVARLPNGDTSVVLGLPGAKLQPGAHAPMHLKVDGTIDRKTDAVIVRPDAVMVVRGKDDALFDGLRKGKVLTIEGPNDIAAFQLKGSTKAIGDLKTCVSDIASGKVKPPPPPVPDALLQVLHDAGLLEQAKFINLENVPAEKRPAEYAWQYGKLLGGVRQLMAAENAEFGTTTNSYIDALKQRCTGEFKSTQSEPESLLRAKLRTATVSCTMPDRKIYMALSFIQEPNRIFTAFFHEGTDADKAEADQTEGKLTDVLRKAFNNAAQPPQPQAPADQGQPPPKK